MSNQNQIQVEFEGNSYFSLIPHILRDLKLDPYEYRVYSELLFYAGQKKACWPSIKKLSDGCGISERKTQQVLNSLCKPSDLLHGNSLIKKISRKDELTGKDSSNLYVVTDIMYYNVKKYSMDAQHAGGGGAQHAGGGCTTCLQTRLIRTR